MSESEHTSDAAYIVMVYEEDDDAYRPASAYDTAVAAKHEARRYRIAHHKTTKIVSVPMYNMRARK